MTDTSTYTETSVQVDLHTQVGHNARVRDMEKAVANL